MRNEYLTQGDPNHGLSKAHVLGPRDELAEFNSFGGTGNKDFGLERLVRAKIMREQKLWVNRRMKHS